MTTELTLFQIIILAIIQGLTEFWPVSSSGHLNLLHLLTDWADQGAMMDVMLHVGSLFAVIIYFWRECLSLLQGFLDLLRGKMTGGAKLFLYLSAASIPLFIFGFLLMKSGLYDQMRSLKVIALANIIFACFLYMADQWMPNKRTMEEMSFKDAMLVGLSQIFALIPGASRSGVTMTAARFLSVERVDAARFAMLLSIPAILGLGAGASLDVYQSGDQMLQSNALVAIGLSFIAAFIAVWFMMALLKRMTMLPFIIYRVLLGIALLWVAFL